MRPQMTAVLAMTADGKIADVQRGAAHFGSPADRAHLERQVAHSDAVLMGAQTLRAYGSGMLVHNEALLAWRQRQGKPPQTLHIICSRSGDLDRDMAFFRQPLARWLVTTQLGAQRWQTEPVFARVWWDQTWLALLAEFAALGLRRIAVLGGGELLADLLAAGVIDDLWLTLCPLLVGGATAPTLVDGSGLPQPLALELLTCERVDQELFLHYRVKYP